ncbi:hypothetical protein EW026_g8076 [Hermanssonia centrifuga]|uniref:Uncharacterized protein n=1 Tax=Hermanssonia centrifuga TaxID=98765 RepID=A0A4S4K5N8_9APHY|nr:hypothetical protein EW026_g8076 [Hermanssonia centrifuga]
MFNYESSPFAFWITRNSEPNAQPLFDTRITSLPLTPILPVIPEDESTALDSFQMIFEDRYLQLASALPLGTHIYGLGEVLSSSGIRRDIGTNGGKGTIMPMWARDAPDPIDENIYGAHPMYLEHRYNAASKRSQSHGVFLFSSAASDILLLTPPSSNVSLIEYRMVGGTLDFYFFSGPTPQKVIEQYGELVGLPAWQPAWAFGFHLCRWGEKTINGTIRHVEKMREANIPLEVMWNDIDLYDAYRDFTVDPVSFPAEEVRAFVRELASNRQYYIPIVDAAIPAQTSSADVYDPYTRGVELDVFMKNWDGAEYIGQVWPGYTVYPDWFAENAQKYWTEALSNWSNSGVEFSGIWLDMNEAASFCDGSCGTDADLSDTTLPFIIPGEPGNLIFRYPEGYNPDISGPSGNVTVNGSLTYGVGANTTVSIERKDIVHMLGWDVVQVAPHAIDHKESSDETTVGPVQNPMLTKDGHSAADEGDLNLNAPPYAIHNGNGRLSHLILATNATHAGGFVELDTHNLWGLMEEKATYHALKHIRPGKRPFIIGRSTFPSAGKYTGHWLGDNFSKWAFMYYSIQGVLQFQLFQIPFVGADTCGFNDNVNEELCNRWMQLSAFLPFYRNHNQRGAIPQEPYRWDSVADASRKAIGVRYSMLPYWYTLFANASLFGTPPVRALFWEFPDEPELFEVDRQYLIGSDILITPVLLPNVSTVQGIFPGRGRVTWRDWYTHDAIEVPAGGMATLSAPLGHINIHVRDGSAILLHAQPAYTITETRQGPYSLLVSQADNGYAFGTAYIDDGESLPPTDSKTLEFRATKRSLKISARGSFNVKERLEAVTILGVAEPTTVTVQGKQVRSWDFIGARKKLVLHDLGLSLNDGASISWK